MRKITRLTFMIFALTASLYSQTFVGFRYEPFYLSSSVISKSSYINNSKARDVFPLSLYFSLTHQFSEKFELTVRPGLLLTWSSSQYNGLEIGIYGKYFYLEDFYLLGGLNIHDNWVKISNSNVKHPVNGVFPLLLLGNGYKISKIFSAELEFLYPLKKQFGNNLIVVMNPIEMDYMIKLSFGLEWEI